MSKPKSDLTLDDFEISERNGFEYITWEELERVMGPVMWEEFTAFMFGQTSFIEGAYAGDVERFLLKLPVID